MREQPDYLTVPIAFFREGVAELEERHFVRTFDSSAQIRLAARQSLSLFQDGRLGPALKRFFDSESCEINEDGVIKFIVSTRGNLFHFSMKSTRVKGHPLNQEEFQSLALLMLTLAGGTVAHLITGAEVQ